MTTADLPELFRLFGHGLIYGFLFGLIVWVIGKLVDFVYNNLLNK